MGPWGTLVNDPFLYLSPFLTQHDMKKSLLHNIPLDYRPRHAVNMLVMLVLMEQSKTVSHHKCLIP